MAADNTSGPGDKWGNSRQAPDLEDVVDKALQALKPLLPGGSPKLFFLVVLLVLIVFGFWTAYYTVPSDSVAVIQRFGKYLKEVPPGLHFKIPLGIDSAVVVPVKRQLKQEFGFTTPGANDPNQVPQIHDERKETQNWWSGWCNNGALAYQCKRTFYVN